MSTLERSLASCVLILSLVPVAGLKTTEPNQSADLSRLLAEYRGLMADRAIREFALWPEERVARDAAPPAGDADPWTSAALALFHLEADLLRVAGLARTDGAVIGPAHIPQSLAVLRNHVIPQAKRSQDVELLAFCRDWYVVFMSLRFPLPDWVAFDALDGARRQMDRDPDMHLLVGTAAVWWMGPEVIGRPYSIGFDPRRPARRMTVGKDVYSADMVREAELSFRQAIALDPNLSEAQLRLGRLMQVTGHKEALSELQRAGTTAARVNNPIDGYLSSLFEGQLHEDAGRAVEARRQYEQAIRIYPPGIAARLALGQALIAAGQETEGWTMSRTVFADEASLARRDPWVVYPSMGYGHAGSRLSRMRARVSRTPLSDGAATIAMRRPSDIGPIVPVSQSQFTLRQDIPTFRSGVDAVRVDALVTTDGRAVTGLTADSFVVTDNGVRQTVDRVAPANTLAAALVIDASDSMSLGPAWKHVQASTAAFRGALAPSDITSVVTAGERPTLLGHKIIDLDALQMLLVAVRGQARTLTALWDAVFAASGLVSEAPGRAVVFVISDGADNSSWFRRPRALSRLAKLGITIDGVSLPWNDANDVRDLAWGDLTLRDDLERSAGGIVFAATDAGLATKVAARFAALRESYVLTYTPTEVPANADGWHEIKVTLKPGVKGKVQARPGYYSPAGKK